MTSFIDQDNAIDWVDTLSEKHYVIIENALTTEVLNGLVKALNDRLEEDRFKKAAIGTMSQKQIDRSIRGDNIFWLDKSSQEFPIQSFFQLADHIKQLLNRYCFLSLSDYEFHFAHYPIGTFYKRHLDQFQGRDNRLISMVLYLNQYWKPDYGGGLKLFLEDKEHIIYPEFGRLVLFKSDLLEHEVMITRKDRFSITGWMLYQPVGLGFLQQY